MSVDFRIFPEAEGRDARIVNEGIIANALSELWSGWKRALAWSRKSRVMVLERRKHNATYEDQFEGHADRFGSCLFRSLVAGLQQSQAISTNPFERQPNRHTQHSHHHRQHEQHRVVLWSEHNENVLEDEPCASEHQ